MLARYFYRLVTTLCIVSFFVLLVIAAMGLSSPVKADGAILYVAPNAVCGTGYSPCFSDIQTAVDAADPGDIIKVAAGIYTTVQNIPSLNREQWGTYFTATQIVAINKTINLQGGYSTVNWDTQDPDSNLTILDAQGQGRCLYIRGDATVTGFRITGGNAVDLGGDPWSGSSNHGCGGGIYTSLSGSTIYNNAIYNNTAEKGGGVFISQGVITVENNRIYENTALVNGGGIDLRYADSFLINNEISENDANGWAGGIQSYGSDATLIGNIIQNNSAVSGGGGVFIFSSGYSDHSLSFTNNVIIDNSVTDPQGVGSAIAVSWQVHPQFIQSTIARNVGGDGSAIFIKDSASATFTNTILSSHATGISVISGSTATINGLLSYNNTTIYGGLGLINTANLYAGDPAFASDGYHLTNASAAINQGFDSDITNDIDGQPRPVDEYDLGADEVMPNVTVDEITGKTLVYTDTQGMTSIIHVPAGAVTATTSLIYVPVEDLTTPAGFAFAGHAFDLEAYQSGIYIPSFQFSLPVTVELHYSDADVTDLDETALLLQTWDEGTSVWVDAACGDYNRHPAENWLAVPICHLSRFGLFAEVDTYMIYLPSVLRLP